MSSQEWIRHARSALAGGHRAAGAGALEDSRFLWFSAQILLEKNKETEVHETWFSAKASSSSAGRVCQGPQQSRGPSVHLPFPVSGPFPGTELTLGLDLVWSALWLAALGDAACPVESLLGGCRGEGQLTPCAFIFFLLSSFPFFLLFLFQFG